MVKLVPVDNPRLKRLRLVPVGEPSQEQINARVATAFDAAENDPNLALGEDLYERGTVLPFAKNKLTGDVSLAVPGILQAGIDAAKLPGEVYSGQEPLYDADGNLRQEIIQRTTDLAAFSPAGTFARSVPQAVKPIRQTAQRNVDDAAEFGIDLSRGQATRRFADQTFEEDALTGGRGAAAQRTLETQRSRQADQIQSAAQQITDNVGASRVDDPFQAVDNVSGALRSRAQELKGRSQALYEAAEGAGAELDPSAIKGLSASLRSSLDRVGAMEGQFVAQEYPTASRALQRVDNLLSKAPEGNIIGVGWQNVERIRKMLLNKGNGPDESRVLGEMRRTFDDWIETSVHDALVSGDPRFLDDLKEARNLYRQYSEITKNSSSIIQKMADGSANSEQIANWLYGASKVGGRTDSSNTLREIKSLIGESHPAIDDLRRGVAMRLFQDRNGEMKSAGKLANDILDFTNNKGHELAKELYGKENLAQLRRFAGVLKNTIPDPKATNPSRSGQTIARQVWDGIMGLAPVLGLAASSWSGMLAGIGLKVGANNAARKTAQKVVSTPVPSNGVPLPGPRSSAVPAIRGTVLGLENEPPPALALPSARYTY